MKHRAILLECIVQLVIGYSLVTYFIEMELDGAETGDAARGFFHSSERAVALFFTAEYVTRWALAARKLAYPFSILAIVDLLAILPFYLGSLIDLRGLRLIRTLRILRLFKLYRYNAAIRSVVTSYARVKDELLLLGGAIVLVVFLSGTFVYEAERTAQPDRFAKYSDGLWWSIVTLTTVGYGDVFPVTAAGRIIACVTLLIGLGIFGSFISLLGGAFVSVMREQRDTSGIRLSPALAHRLEQVLADSDKPICQEEADFVLDEAMELYRKRRQLESPE